MTFSTSQLIPTFNAFNVCHKSSFLESLSPSLLSVAIIDCKESACALRLSQRMHSYAHCFSLFHSRPSTFTWPSTAHTGRRPGLISSNCQWPIRVPTWLTNTNHMTWFRSAIGLFTNMSYLYIANLKLLTCSHVKMHWNIATLSDWAAVNWAHNTHIAHLIRAMLSIVTLN